MISYFRYFISIAFLAGFFLACSSPPPEDEVAAAVYDVNILLNNEDCNSAYYRIIPFYNDANKTNNAVRIAMAATYGCMAGVNVITIATELESNGSAVVTDFWELLVSLFPSSAGDEKPAAAGYGMDAAFAAVQVPFILPVNQVNALPNLGSLFYGDRVSDANSGIFMLSMALMGTLLNWYGNVLPNDHKGQNLQWSTAAGGTAAIMQGDGCALAAGLLNFLDSLTFLSQQASGGMKNVYQSLEAVLNSAGGLDAACAIGCNTCNFAGGTANCVACPFSLRNRSSCAGTINDNNSCAGQGLIDFINATWLGPP